MILFHKGNTDLEIKPKLFYKKWLKAIATEHKSSIRDLNYIYQTDEELLKLNQEHLKHDTYTDIITFDNRDTEGPIEGDIFISVDRVKENAKDFKVVFEIELRRVMAHGLLHLIGFGDKSDIDKKEMRKAENQALKIFDEL